MLATWVIEELTKKNEAREEARAIELELEFNDKRLEQRFATILSDLSERPTASLSAACGGYAELYAAYRFFNNKKVTFENVLAPHIESSLARMREHPVVILAQDTTEIDLTRPQQQVQGAGTLDGNSRFGLFLHPLLAFTPEGTPLGLSYAEAWTRSDKPKQEDESQKRNGNELKRIPIEEKESYRWVESYRQGCLTAAELPDTQTVVVADSEADIYELLQESQQEPRQADWIVRACQNRALKKENDPDAQAENRLRERVMANDVLFTQVITVRGRQAKVSCETRGRRQPRESRVAEVEVRAGQVTLRPPWRPDRKLQPVTVNVVLVSEINPPAGDTPVEWMLLTSLPVGGVEQARTVVQYYCVRWMSEVYFRTLKSGCRVEARRFEHIDRVLPCLAVYMIVAWRTLYVCHLGREFPEISCEAVFEPAEWKSVYKVIHKKPAPQEPPTLQEMVRTVAQLGGYVNRPRSDEPGPQTVWLGLQRAYDIATCWRLFGPGSSSRRESEDLPVRADL